MNQFVLIISGPTASGKTAFSEKISKIYPCEIINSDMGQFYKPLSIGTAKPDLSKVSVEHHLFDIIDKPENLTIFQYYKLTLEKINHVLEKGKLPVIVGGSLFYLKSLYFSPKQLENKKELQDLKNFEKDGENLWETLKQIDPDRAEKLHPNDSYRISRALEIWHQTGIKPSLHNPLYDPKFNSIFVFINPDKEILQSRINKRTEEMILKDEWIQEAEQFLNTEWEIFLKTKGLIGYPEILDWIKHGKKAADIYNLVSDIQLQTRQYAKKQITFWKSFKKLLIENKNNSNFKCETLELNSSDEKAIVFLETILKTIF